MALNKEYLIIDDGHGMDRNGMLHALTLGSPSDNYEPNSLSKFGLGLKSASFSQGEVLEIISSPGDSTPFQKLIVSLNNIRKVGEYGAEEEVTQLPHPPSLKLHSDVPQAETRKKYHIEAGNYGFYVYRNGRLLSWAESFGIIPQDQDFYAFRGRIIIDSSADEIFNLDVKKSQIHLSDDAYKTIEDVSAEYRRTSKKAWERAKHEIKRREGTQGFVRANTLAQQFELPDELPGAPDTEEAYIEAKQREQEIIQEQNERIQKLVQQTIQQKEAFNGIVAISPEESEPTPEQVQSIVAGEAASRQDQIFLVNNTEDNVLDARPPASPVAQAGKL